jgi:hypothetical protein
MIEQIVGASIVPILQDLTWADKIAWMAVPWTRQGIDIDGIRSQDQTFPAAYNVLPLPCEWAGDTNTGMKYIMPDANFRSLILISAEGDNNGGIATNIAMRKGVNIDQDIMISVWMNDHQRTTHIAKAQIIQALYRLIVKNLSVPYYQEGTANDAHTLHINKIKVSYQREINGNPFDEYSFSNNQPLFHNTYSSFGMVFKITGLVFPMCFPEYPTLDHSCPVDFTVTATAEFDNVCTGGQVTLTGEIDGVSAPIAYQWQKLNGATWEDVDDATSIEYETIALTGIEGTIHTYRLKATKAGFVNYSDPVVITVNDDPSIFITTADNSILVSQSTDIIGESIGGLGANTYQWQYLDGAVWEDIDGATEIAITIEGSTYGAGSHSFRLMVNQSAPGCSGNSTPLIITIT